MDTMTEKALENDERKQSKARIVLGERLYVLTQPNLQFPSFSKTNIMEPKSRNLKMQ